MTLELYDPEAREWEPVEDPSEYVATWGRNRPPVLMCDGQFVRTRFRIMEEVSAGTDRWLLVDAISGTVVVDQRPPGVGPCRS